MSVKSVSCAPRPSPLVPLLQQRQAGKSVNVLMLYLHRYLRLTPAYMFALFFLTYIVPHFTWGPYWGSDFSYQRDTCQHQWWQVGRIS